MGAIPSPLATVTEGVGARPSAQVPSLDHFPTAHATGGVISLSGVMAMTIAAQTLPTTSQLVICTQCGSTWTIDNMDRDWHTPTHWCSVCDVPLPTPHAESSVVPIGQQVPHVDPCGYCEGDMMGQEVWQCHECECIHHAARIGMFKYGMQCSSCSETWCCTCQDMYMEHESDG